MKSKTFKTIAFALLGVFCFSMFNIHPTLAANYDVCNSSAAQEVKDAAGCDKGNANELPDVIQNILYAIIGIASLIAVVYIIIGGINYMTSSGDTSKLEKARKTILYSVIGLVVCALAFAIVNWTIGVISRS